MSDAAWTGVGGTRVVGATGATSGIGLAAARRLATLGAYLALIARSPERAAAAVTEIAAAARRAFGYEYGHPVGAAGGPGDCGGHRHGRLGVLLWRLTRPRPVAPIAPA
ncbi:MAG: SDR family oxidoreductase [Chloroflexi bacterium]|nr:SDR family oxidoreductase [Chloroflexota bacterium]